MAAHEESVPDFEAAVKDLQYHWYDRIHRQRTARPKPRDDQGFRKRGPKLTAAIALAIAAVLSALAGVIYKRRGR